MTILWQKGQQKGNTKNKQTDTWMNLHTQSANHIIRQIFFVKLHKTTNIQNAYAHTYDIIL